MSYQARVATVVLIAACLSGCMTDDMNLKVSAEIYVRAMLKDPDSAEFGDVYLVAGAKNEGLQDFAI